MPGTRIVDLPDLGTPTDSASFVAELAGSGRILMPALRSYITTTVAANLAAEVALRKGVRLSAMDGFGCVGNGTTDDTTALQAALNSLTHGGTLHLPAGYSFRVGNLTIPIGVTLEGPYPSGVGAPGMGNYSPPYNNLSFIRTNAGTSITLSGGAALCGLLIAPYGMSFQQPTSAAFAGTCIVGGGDDMIVENCMIMGYSQAFFSDGKSRVRIRDCNVDCQTGFTINNSGDVCHLENVQCWPFATISVAATDTLRRSGSAFAMTGGTDDSRFVSCFSYGYNCGFAIDSCGGIALIGCAADHTNAGYGTGFAITGTSTLCTMSSCLASAMVNGFYFSATTANTVNFMTDCVAYANQTNGVLIDAAAVSAVTIRGGSVTDGASGIAIASTTAPVDIDGVFFRNITTPNQTIFATVSTANVRIGALNNYGTLAAGNAVAGGNLGTKAIASADPLTLLPNSHIYNVTGTASFGSLTGGWAGRQVTLIFQGALTVFSANTGVSAVMRLQNDLAWRTTTGATLTLLHSGSQWFEIGRSAGASVPMLGTSTNDSAFSGFVGEIIEVTRVAGSAVSLTTGVAADLATIVLSPGDWDVSGTVAFLTGGAMTIAQGWVASASVTPPAPGNPGYAIMNAVMGGGTQLPTGTQRFSLAVSTTIYFSTLSAFSATTVSAFGNIRARRVR